jgi:serine/threonine-protein kinase
MTLDGRYLLVSHIASGGMGAIFRARHVYMKNELALKVLRPDLSSLPDLAERFRREAEIAAALEHDNIVRVTDFARSPEGWLFLAMELLEGESLFDRLRRGPLSPEEAIRILVQMCRGLEAAHAHGVVHRDLKPENVFLADRPRGLVKLLDFGIAKLTDQAAGDAQDSVARLTDQAAASETQDGVVVGTPEYLSPEQATGGTVDGRADLYAAGLIGWRMLAGHHPFQASDASGLVMMQATQPVPPLADSRPDLEAWPGLLAAIGRACAKDVGERHASAAELCAEFELARQCGKQGPDGHPRRPDPREPRPSPRADDVRTSGPQVGGSAGSPRTPQSTSSRDSTILGGSRPLSGESPTDLAAQATACSSDRRTRVRWSLRTAPIRASAFVHRHALLSSLVFATAVLLPLSLATARWLEERPIAQAQELLAAGHPEAARDVIAPAVLRRPTSARLRVLHGHALHRMGGEATAAIEAYAAAIDLDPRALDSAAFSDLADDLSRDRKLADRSARLLARARVPAIPAVLSVARSGRGVARLRALDLARQLGAEERIDRVTAYGELLEDEDCDVRRSAADRLGEMGNPAALPRLTELAGEARDVHGRSGRTRRVMICGAAEADAAIERIEKR